MVKNELRGPLRPRTESLRRESVADLGWTEEDDRQILELYNEHADLGWTEEDDRQILELYNEHGRKWTMIATKLEEHGRIVTGQDVKRRFRFITEIANMDRRLAMPVLPGIEHFPFPFSLD